jgi:altronate dehydratase small subunit
MKAKVVVLNLKDNVATTLEELRKGDDIEVSAAGGKKLNVKLNDGIPFGHKFSIAPIGKGQAVIKYGETIGTADTLISPGDYVHVHNVSSTRGREKEKK